MIYLFTYCIRCYSKRGLASDRSLNGINAVPLLSSTITVIERVFVLERDGNGRENGGGVYGV
jgi:hypothetical protein